jgi:hypothetical protein
MATAPKFRIGVDIHNLLMNTSRLTYQVQLGPF